MKRYELQNSHYEYNIWEAESEERATMQYIEQVLGRPATLGAYESYCEEMGVASSKIEWIEV
jgi:hypothetical protein